MARILLISENTRTAPYPVYPTGMAIIADALTQGGHRVRQYDLLFPSCPLPSVLETFRPDIVGISVRNVDSSNSLETEDDGAIRQLNELVQSIRQHSSAKILLGGTGFSVMPQEMLLATGAEAGIVGPGEGVICEEVEKLLKGTAESASVRFGRFEPSAIPSMDMALARLYQEAGGILGLMTKRGCTHRCAYCVYPQMDGRQFRPYDPQKIVAHIKELEERAGTERIFFTDSVFNDANGYAVALAREMVRQKTKVRFTAYFSPANMDLRQLELFQKAGLGAIELGTDASTDATLAGLGKSFRFAQVEAFQEACTALKIPCAHFVIFGGPNETPQTLGEGLKNMERLPNCVVIAFSGVRVYRGTSLHERAVREGKISSDADLVNPFYYFSDSIDIPEINAHITAAFRGWRDRIFPPHQVDEITATLRRLGIKNVHWDSLIHF